MRRGQLQHAMKNSYLELSNVDDTRAAKVMENKYVGGLANGAPGTNYCNGNPQYHNTQRTSVTLSPAQSDHHSTHRTGEEWIRDRFDLPELEIEKEEERKKERTGDTVTSDASASPVRYKQR